MEPVCFVAQGENLEHKAVSDEKPMQITKEINSVLLTCAYVADDSSKLWTLCNLLSKFSVAPCNSALQ